MNLCNSLAMLAMLCSMWYGSPSPLHLLPLPESSFPSTVRAVPFALRYQWCWLSGVRSSRAESFLSMWLFDSYFGSPTEDEKRRQYAAEQQLARDNEDVLQSNNGIYMDPELMKSNIDPPPSLQPNIETIFSRFRRPTVGSAAASIVDLSSNPLPTPPKGMQWEHKNGEWKCVIVEALSACSKEGAQDQMGKDLRTIDDDRADEYIWVDHVVMPEDTIRGICLKYRCNVVDLRRHNNFSGDAFRSRKKLRIKVNRKHIDEGNVLIQDKSLMAVKVQELKSRIQEPSEECMFYLRENDCDVDKAFNSWKEDEKFAVLHHPPTHERNSDFDKKNAVLLTSKNTKKSIVHVSEDKKNL